MCCRLLPSLSRSLSAWGEKITSVLFKGSNKIGHKSLLLCCAHIEYGYTSKGLFTITYEFCLLYFANTMVVHANLHKLVGHCFMRVEDEVCFVRVNAQSV